MEIMFGEKCKICKGRFPTDYITLDVCVFCKNKTNKFCSEGMLMTKEEAIEYCREFERLIREEVKLYGRYRCH